MKTVLRTAGWMATVATLAIGCGEDSDHADSSQQNATSKPADGAGTAYEIKEFQELVIVDSAIVLDDRAKNETCGAWSFCHLMTEMAPAGAIEDGVDKNDFVKNWLLTFHGKTPDG